MNEETKKHIETMHKNCVSKDELQIILLKSGISWDKNGNVKNAVNQALVAADVEDLKEASKKSVESRPKFYMWAVGIVLVIVSSVFGSWLTNSSQITVGAEKIADLETEVEKLRLKDDYLKRVLDQSYHDNEAKYVTKETFQVYSNDLRDVKDRVNIHQTNHPK